MKNIIASILILVLFSGQAQAAVFSLESNSNPVGQDQLVMLKVKFDGEDQKINAVAGELTFNPIGVEIVNVYDGDTVITSWLERPRVSTCLAKCVINFSGIIAGGFSGVLSPYYKGTRPGNLFNVLVKVKTVGEIGFNIDSPQAYLHDGEGTPVQARVEQFYLHSVSDKPLAQAPDLTDNRAPEPFTISLSRDKNSFGNKYFIAFNPQDKGSGISYIEVKEGDLEYVRATSPYILKNQKLGVQIQVRAVDYSGNETIASIHPAPDLSRSNNIIFWVIILVLFVTAVVVRWYDTKRKK